MYVYNDNTPNSAVWPPMSLLDRSFAPWETLPPPEPPPPDLGIGVLVIDKNVRGQWRLKIRFDSFMPEEKLQLDGIVSTANSS
jgi:hypothetical protein